MTFPDATITALLGLACGDAYGCPFEFSPRAEALARLSFSESRYLTGKDCGTTNPRRFRTPGLGSDDTQQALILLWCWEQLTRHGRDPVNNPELVAELFYRVCVRMSRVNTGPTFFGVHRGTGSNFRRAITTGIAPDSAGLGAAMRVGPYVTLLPSTQHVVDHVVAISRVTTTSAAGIAAAVFYGISCWVEVFGFGGLRLSMDPEIHRWFNAIVGMRNKTEEEILAWINSTGVSTHTVVNLTDGLGPSGVPFICKTVWENQHRFGQVLQAVVRDDGDADTVCAIAGCLAALTQGRASIPPWMLEQIVGLEWLEDPTRWHPLSTEMDMVAKDMAVMRGAVSRKKAKHDPPTPP